MNDRHPSGTTTTPAPASDADSAPYASYGTQEAPYDGFTSYHGYDTGAQHTGHYAADPLFGSLPDAGTGTGTGDNAYGTGQWNVGAQPTMVDTGGHQLHDTSGHHVLNYDPYAAQHHAAYDSGAYDTTGWPTGHQQLPLVPPQTSVSDTGGHWDANAWLQPDQSGNPADQTQHWEWGTQTFETGTYDATQWNSDGDSETGAASDAYEQPAEVPFDQQATATFESVGHDEQTSDGRELSATGELPAVSGQLLLDDQEESEPAPATRAAARNASRSRRRTPPKRSALLTVAVPSACVMGVAGIAAASVGTLTGGDDKDTTATASDAQAVKPSAANNKLDSQLETLSAEADNFADRASRTQERIDLKEQQAAEKKKAAAEAARKERLRPKYALPVAQRGLSAYFGQAGVNWMSQHTGIDFPVSYGTTVMSATDGTVRTQWNSAYGNMLIVTAKDGTETWYCHLSTYRVASGTTVKAGDPIAYSGNSGNSTGPHLHFEVRPAGGSPIDPLPWLRSHGLDPT
ncbi:M23 family metallopeptidase [Streptomyces griseoruber]|uniref:Peptidase M23 n=1 Tax=Streptomyces griseoruber TaxID=1943 RepID=A0A124I3N0_9ACTN|nr:M23 family metallopeptidase [Streptomyces griseoruber]KUN84419.1 peptidase M23 [Streptomyces griseoruber]